MMIPGIKPTQVYTLFALANFYIARKKLIAVAG